MNTSVLTGLYNTGKKGGEKLLFYSFIGVFLTMPMGTSLPTLCGAIAVIIWLFSGMAARLISRTPCLPAESDSRKEKPVSYLRHPWFRPVLLFMILPWIGLLYTPDAAGLGIQYAKKTYYWIYCLAIASIAFVPFSGKGAERNLPEKFIHAFLLGLAINALVGTAQFSGVLPMVQGKWYSGLERGYSTLSAYLVLGILIASYYFREATEKKIRFLLCALILFYFFHLGILEGRAGYLTFILLSPLIAYNMFNRSNILKISLASVLLAGMLCLSPIVRDRIALSMDQITYHLNANPNAAWGRQYSDKQDRFYMWRGACHLFMENPIIGIGTGGYQKALKERGKPDDPLIAHPHNDFLYMAVCFGMIGIFAFCWFFAELIKNAWKHRKTPLGYFVLSAALVLLTGGLFNGYLLDAGTISLLAVVTGLQRSFQKCAAG
ncbi:MAG: O-antigen ligase family protein [Pseudomonadota bacterium]